MKQAKDRLNISDYMTEEDCKQNAENAPDSRKNAFEEINNLNRKTMRAIMINSAIMLAVNLIYLIYQISIFLK